MLVRRLKPALFLGLVALSAAAGIGLMTDALAADGMAALEIAIIALFSLNFTWIAMSFWTAAIGFAVRLFKTAPGAAPEGLVESEAPLRARTAVVMPVYNEDTSRVFAGLEAMCRSLEATGEVEAFDFFLLSDSTQPDVAAAERAAWRRLRQRLDNRVQVFYRHRARNVGRKAGNIADFCRRWGGHYEHMLVLDADSLMTGRAMLRLARLMQANPRAGIIQTLPVPIGHDSLFARVLQFASRLYAPVLASGLSFWHGSSATYWGHNAIIRIEAFVANCGLPLLPGSAPLGGEILSHDFVEAALIKRGGWDVWLLPDIDGSYEEVPPNPLDYARRDRRWCQGNLQHLKLLPARGFSLLSRTHFVMGVMAYLSSLLWLVLLLLSTADILSRTLFADDSAWAGFPFFPVWPEVKTPEMLALFAATIVMLVLPKLLAMLRILTLSERRRRYGGAAALLGGTVIEILFSALRAPAMMLFHAGFVVAVLLGRDSGWAPQQRGDRGVGLSEALRRHGGHTALGAAWAAAVFGIAPEFGWWLSPVLIGLLLSVPLCMLASSRAAGESLRRLGLLSTPEEMEPPYELKHLAELLTIWREPAATATVAQPLGVVVAATVAATSPPRLRLHSRPVVRRRHMPMQRLEYPNLPWLRSATGAAAAARRGDPATTGAK